MILGNRIDKTFDALKETKEKALVSYITAGDPDLNTTKEIVLQMEQAGVDIIEVGVPFSDPVADGPVIEKAAQRALQKGVSLKKIIEMVKELREHTNIPILLMGYFNPLFRYGLEGFVEDASAAGVDGVIIPDLPYEESAELNVLLSDHGMHLIQLVAPTTTDERLQQICGTARGFIYCVSVTGVTGMRSNNDSNLEEFMSRVERFAKIPTVVGFGISGSQQAKEAGNYCDGVVVGSAFVKLIHDRNSDKEEMLSHVADFAKDLKNALNS